MHPDEITRCPDLAEKLEGYAADQPVGGEAEHAMLAPSSAHRWVNCPGSVQAELQYPNVETEESQKGTACHWVGEQILRSYLGDSGLLMGADFIDRAAPNGIIIDEEMCESAEIYVLDVLEVCQAGGYLQLMRIEERVAIPRVHELNWGTPDCSVFVPSGGRLTSWDLKFGRVAVDSWKNWQLIDYNLGLLDGLDVPDDMVTLDMRIVQPRSFHVGGICRSWVINGAELRSYANQLKIAADLALSITPPCKAGEWCRDCKAVDCMTLQREASSIAERTEALQLHNLSPENAAVELRYLQRAYEILKQRKKALEAQTFEQIKSNIVIPGYGIGYGRGSVNWIKSNAEVIALGDLMDVELRKPEEPITPTQAKKLRIDEAVVNGYCKKYNGAARLVTVENTTTSRIFAKNHAENKS